MNFNKILIIGAGYVGTSIAVLLGQKFEVTLIDSNKLKVNLINDKKSPIKDSLIEKFLNEREINIKADIALDNYLECSDLIILALPTNYIEKHNAFDTKVIESVLRKISKVNHEKIIIIKSTVPIGFTERINKKYRNLKIIFSPEFLREGYALYDNLYPSRIVIGDTEDYGKMLGNLLSSFALNNPNIYLMNNTEAESVKLFANTYLATRVSFFNELDSFCMKNKLSSKSIIDAVSSDLRIGTGYNNPSFGYGGYCLPKDTKQLLSNFYNIPQDIFSAVVKSNSKRKKFISNFLLNNDHKTLGIYRLVMKKGSDNFRESAVLDIIKDLKGKRKLLIYEPELNLSKYQGIKVIKDLNEFIQKSDLIIANRLSDDLQIAKEKVFSRDIFLEN